MIRRLWRIVLALGVLIALVGVSATTSFADGPKPSSPKETNQPHNGADPTHIPTADERKALAQKEAELAQYRKKRENQITILSGSRWLNVGYYQEPNDAQHVNYCGPGATQVALSARGKAEPAPNWADILGQEEKIDPSWGVYNWRIRDTLNRRLLPEYPFYVESGASSQGNFEYRIMLDIDNDHVMVTGLRTGGMPGWDRDVYHIVAVYGYFTDATGPIYAYYTETAAPRAGYSGNYQNSMTTSNLWNKVIPNNSQVW